MNARKMRKPTKLGKFKILIGISAGGDASDVKKSDLGKYVLVSFWSVKDDGHHQDVLAFENLSQKYKHRADFHMASFWTDVFTEFMDQVGKDPDLYGQRQWWPMTHIHNDRYHRRKNEDNRNRIGWDDIDGWRTPRLFLAGQRIQILGNRTERLPAVLHD